MKLASYYINDRISYGAVVQRDGITFAADLPSADAAFPETIERFLALGEDGIAKAQELVDRIAPCSLIPLDAYSPAPVCPNAEKILCVGLNYADHVKECENWEMPKRPVIFNKALNALTAHKAEVAIPVTTSQPDFEAELVVVIGKEGKRLSESQAMDCVAGYCCGNDLTARDWQMGCPGKQWFLGKSFDSFAPVGPWIVTKDEIPDPQALAIRSILNGQVMQDSNTKNFIFSVPRIISHISQGITLKPGDLIFTGSPPGIGYSRNPSVFLCDGDVIEIEIEGVGTLSNRIVRV
ncbi:MAG: fumarylacetoacetate hydrolase family protein [Thermoguttaceae bacterium]|nr:fumarylacetoacetate hydrolase family protein [Thermoguttaceae bacterium]